MQLISFFTKALHYLPSELSHFIALKGLKAAHSLGLLNFLYKSHALGVVNDESDNLFQLKNKIGIAAGLDKNGDYIDCLAALGVGFIEVGTVTPKPQFGNPKPRIFRDRKNKSILNRLGFNNKGVDYLVERLKQRKSNVILGSSVGKNFDTENANAYVDYLLCIEKVYEYSDYIAVNISSPNTKDLRKLSDKDFLNNLLNKIKVKQNQLSAAFGYKPIFLKISPDENSENLKTICETILENKLDGIICSNTSSYTSKRYGSGGLSGAPLKNKATEKLQYIKELTGEDVKIIASGGVMSSGDFQEKIDAGADLVQIYSGFIFEGPRLIYDVQNKIVSQIKT